MSSHFQGKSFLKEILNEAFGNLQDSSLNTLEITRVQCSKGKYDAKIFIESSYMSDNEKKTVIQAFKKARPIIQEYVLNATSWHTSPKLSLEFDETLLIQNRLDAIFAQIHKKS